MLYFAILEEGAVPAAVTGTATGIVSIIGYTPDIFVPLAGGYLLDIWPESTAYRTIFAAATLYQFQSTGSRSISSDSSARFIMRTWPMVRPGLLYELPLQFPMRATVYSSRARGCWNGTSR